MPSNIYPTYFLQTQSWASFWLAVNPKNHQVREFGEGFLSCFVYEYPWQFRQKFWYIPRLATVDFTSISSSEDRELILQTTKNLLQKILQTAQKEGICFVKLDFNDQLIELLGYTNLKQLNQELLLKNFNFPTNLRTKIIQFTGTMFLSLQELELNSKLQKAPINLVNLKIFVEKNTKFYKTLEKNTRRLTIRSLDRNWQIITTKNEVNFEIFYNLLSQTAKRQKFPIQTKEYLQKLYSQDFFQVFLLQKDGQFLASWSGIISDNTLVNLYNGNLPEGFKDFSQYFLHLVAMFFAKQNNLEFYDFGGYNPKLSFSSFKDGYKGQIREFFGPVDIILDSKKYKTTNFTITTIKILKKIFSPFK